MELTSTVRARDNATADVEVVFREKIGMHDITVVHAGNVSELVGWMSSCAEWN